MLANYEPVMRAPAVHNFVAARSLETRALGENLDFVRCIIPTTSESGRYACQGRHTKACE